MGCTGLITYLLRRKENLLTRGRPQQSRDLQQKATPLGHGGELASPQHVDHLGNVFETSLTTHCINPERPQPLLSSPPNSFYGERNEYRQAPPTQHEQDSYRPTRLQKPWWEATDQELREEYERIRSDAPVVDPDFLWCQRRDSLHNDSILAARGVKVADRHPLLNESCAPSSDDKGSCECHFCSQSQPEFCLREWRRRREVEREIEQDEEEHIVQVPIRFRERFSHEDEHAAPGSPELESEETASISSSDSFNSFLRRNSSRLYAAREEAGEAVKVWGDALISFDFPPPRRG